MALTDNVSLPLAQKLLACLCAKTALESNPPKVCSLRYGTTVNAGADECRCGIAWVRLGEVYPTQSFPERVTDPSACPNSFAVELEMGILRCAPIGTAQAPASASEWEQFSLDISEDEQAMAEAVCCFTATMDRSDWLDLGSTPLDTEGGCGGRIHNLVVQAFCAPC